MSPVNVALTVNGHLGVIMVDRDRIRERPLYRGHLDYKKRKGASDKRP